MPRLGTMLFAAALAAMASAGGGTDIIARLVAQKLGERWGQAVGEQSSAQQVAVRHRARFHFHHPGRLRADGRGRHPALPAKTLGELIAYARAHPGAVILGDDIEITYAAVLARAASRWAARPKPSPR